MLVQASTLLIQLISVPVLIHFWGVTYYGEWLLLVTIPSYLSLSDVGLVSALSNELLIRVSKNDRTKATRLLGSGLTVVFGVGSLVASGLLLVLYLTDFTGWLKFTQIAKQDAWLTLSLLMLYVILCLQQELIAAVPRAEGHNARGRVWITLTRLLEFGIMVGLVSLGCPIWSVAIGYVIIRGFSSWMMLLHYRMTYEWVRGVAIGYFSAREMRPLATPSLSFLGFSVANAVVLQGSTLLIGIYMTPIAVVLYTTLRTLNNCVRQVIGMVSYALWPEFTRALAANDIPKAIMLHRRLCQIAFWGSCLLLVGLEATGTTILAVWTKGAVQPQQPVFSFLLLATLPYSLWNTSATTLISVNRHQRISFFFLSGSLLALALASLLLPRYGLAGLAISLLINDCIVLIWVFQNTLRVLYGERVSSLLHAIVTDFKWIVYLKKAVW
ncbi:lipopolysaccharide biosynthesis protein [Larkinella sp. VNQ87]|uniref:lipopolysaccharide biosynthesis protein n=1 Tax=Larkinella sp. VNQ87 TaxID=3400921 RepID=UPI003C0A0302